MPKLVIAEGSDVGKVFVLRGEKFVIGRNPKNDLYLNDSRASRHHAELCFERGAYTLRDMGSCNGTFVNEEEIFGKHRLDPGDRIEIGATTLVFDPLNASSVSMRGQDSDYADSEPVLRMPVGDDGTLLGFRVEEHPKEGIEDPLTRLRIVYHYADRMRLCFDIDALSKIILDAMFEIVHPDRAAVLLARNGSNELEAVASRSLHPHSVAGGSASFLVSSTIVRRCVEESSTIVIADTDATEKFKPSESMILGRIGAVIACPLISGDDIYGVLYMDVISRHHKVSGTELELLSGIASQAALAVGNALHHQDELSNRDVQLQLDVARRIHDNLIADDFFENDQLIACSINRPCSRVGGDYFGIFQTATGPLFTVSDSTGHGIGAALIMSTARAYLIATLASTEMPLNDLMSLLNRLLSKDMDQGLFVSMAMVRFEENARRLRTILAGHHPPLLFRPSTDEFLPITCAAGMVLGLVGESEFDPAGECHLESGDRIVLFTDGVIEQTNDEGKEFTLARLRQAVAEHGAKPPAEALDAILDAIQRFRGASDQDDDITLVMIQVK